MSTNMLFVCDSCGCVDSLRMVEFTGHGMRCSECETGHWHNHFAKETYDPNVHNVINRSNHQYGDDGETSFS